MPQSSTSGKCPLIQVTAQHQICDAAKGLLILVPYPTQTKRSSCTHGQTMRTASDFNVSSSCVIASPWEVSQRRGVLSSPITPCLHSPSPPGYRLTIYGTHAGDLPAEHLKHGWCGCHDVSPILPDIWLWDSESTSTWFQTVMADCMSQLDRAKGCTEDW